MNATSGRLRRIPFACLTLLVVLASLAMSLIGGSTGARAQPAAALEWTSQFDPGEFQEVNDIAVTSGGIYVSTGAYLRKYDVAGNPVWTRAMDCAGVAADTGGVYVMVHPNSLQRLDAAGNPVWALDLEEYHYWYFSRICVYSGGMYVTGGIFNDGGEHVGDFVRRYDLSGNLDWSGWVGGHGLDSHVWGITACSTGAYVGLFDAPDYGHIRNFVVKFDSDGDEVWTREMDSISVAGWGISADATGVYAVKCAGAPENLTGAFLHKLDVNGDEVWEREVVAGAYSGGLAVSSGSGGIYVAGSVSGTLPGQTSSGGSDAFVCLYDSEGNRDWTRQFGSGADDGATAVATGDSGIYVGGSTSGTLPDSQGTGGAFLSGFVVAETPAWDINQDGRVDYKDVARIGAGYGYHTGDACYDPAADINGDGVIDYRDLAILGAHYGESY